MLKNRKTSGPHHPEVGNTSRDINYVFPHKVCINLDRRTGRWEKMEARFDLHGLAGVRRFSAVDGNGLSVSPGWTSTPGAYGCLLSHLQVVSEARKLGLASVLIFEDDVVFDTHLRKNFRAFMNQVPPDWNILYFGALHMDDPIDVSDNVKQIRRAYSTYAYALKDTIFDAFIEANSTASTAVDVNSLALQTDHACYCFMPHLAWVETGYSDAQGRENNHWYLQESLVIHGSGMDNLLNQTSVIIAYSNPTRSNGVMLNLLFLARFYRERLPAINVVIVEQDSESTIEHQSLREGCQYFLLRVSGPLNKGLCFNTGMSIANPASEFVIFSDSDIFVEEWDICGNLRMCERYDCTTGFGSMIDLTSADTLELRRDRAMLLRWFNASAYSTIERHDSFSKYCVFNRRSIQAAGGWDEQSSEAARLRPSLRDGQHLRFFEASNHALRLHHD